MDPHAINIFVYMDDNPPLPPIQHTKTCKIGGDPISRSWIDKIRETIWISRCISILKIIDRQVRDIILGRRKKIIFFLHQTKRLY